MRFRPVPADTTPEAQRVLLDIYRRMTPQRRLDLACEMSDYLRATVTSGVRARHPEYTERQVHLAVTRLMVGEKLFRQAFPGVEIAP